MEEKGIIVKVDGEYATVRVEKKDECSKCGMCLFPKNACYTEISAKNTVNASVGDNVTVTVKKEEKLLGSVLAFGVPLVLIGLSFLITYLLKIKEIFVVVISIVSVAIWYTFLGLTDKKFKEKRKNVSEITEKNL